MSISRSEFDDLSTSSASMLIVTMGNMKLYSRLLRIMPESFKIAICVGLKHEPIKEVAMLPKRRVFATLSRKYSGTDKEITQLDHRIQQDFGIPIPICLDNKSTTVRVVIFLVTNDKSMIPVCRSLIRLSSTRDPTTSMKWFPLVKYNGFKGIECGGSSDEFETAEENIDAKYKKHYIVGSIQILTRRVLQDRIGEPDMIDILGFVVDAKETKSEKAIAEQYDDTTSDYEYSDKDLSSKENNSNVTEDDIFNGKYSSRIKGCYLESTCESLGDKIPFPFIKFKDIIGKYPILKNLFHFIPQYNQKINGHMIRLMKKNREGKIVLLGDDFFSKYRSGISVDIKIPTKIDFIINDSLDWQTWLSKSMDVAVMQSVEAYHKSTVSPGTGKYKAGRYDMNKKSKENYVGNKLALYKFDYFMKAMESNMDLLLLNTIFGAAATEFARDIIDDIIFSGRNQTKKFNPYKNLFIIWKYIIKRGYQELGFDCNNNDNNESDIDSTTFENKVGEERIDTTNAKDSSDEEYNIKILQKNYLKLENDFDEFSEIAKFDESVMENCINVNEMPNNSLLNNDTIPLYNSLKRRIVDSIEREKLKPLPPDHPISSLRLFKRDLVFVYNKTIGRGLIGILVLGDEETSSEEASKIYTREISAHMAINEAILRTKVKKAIRIYNSIPKGKINRRNIMNTHLNSLECSGSNPVSKKVVTADELTKILLKGISKYSNLHEDIFHPAISLTAINPTLITCVDYSGFRMVVRPLPVTPLNICDWPLPIQSAERSEIYNIEKCLNISNILHPTILLSKVKHLPILLEYSLGLYNFYMFHHTYNIFPKDPWVSDIKGERVNWGNSSTDDYYYNYNRNLVMKNLSRNKHCTLRPLLIKQNGAVQDMLKHQNNQENTIRRLRYTSQDLLYLWKKELSPTGFCLLCSSDIQLRVFGFLNVKRDLTNLETVELDVMSKNTETTGNGLIKIKDSTYCSLCGKSIRLKESYDELDLKINKRTELISYIGNKIPYPSLGNLDDGPGIKMNRTKLLTSYMNTTSEYFSEWGLSEGDIYRRDEIVWERKPGLYCLPRTCIRGGGNLLGTGLDTIKYLLSQGKFVLTDYDLNVKVNNTSYFNRESKIKIINGIDVFDESKRQDTIKLFFDDTNVGQEIILLSNSLHTNWLAIILHQLESIPVFTPYDSITLECFLHSRGVNCNLMGRMLNYTRSPWLKQLLSVEIVSRTIKSLIPRIIKTLYLPGAISVLKEEKGNYGKYCPCHLSSPSITMLHTVFKQYITSIERRKSDDFRGKNHKYDSNSRIMSSKIINSDLVADQDKLINGELLNSKEKIPSHSTSLSIQSPIYWNEIFSLLNENKWEVLNIYNIDLSEISKILIDWASKYYNIDDDIGVSMWNNNNNRKNINEDDCLLSELLGNMNKLTFPYWVLEALFDINKKSLMGIKRHKFQQITIIQIVLTNIFNLILGDSPESQLFWTKCISKLCSVEFTIAENSISKNKIPIGALYTSLQHHTGIKFYMDIKKLKDSLLKDPSFPIKYDDFNMILPKTKRNTEQYYSESLPIWGMLETPELIRLPRYNNFSLVSTPTISQKLIAISIKLSASYFTNVQLLFDYLTHTELFKGSERHLVRQDWLVQESWLELLGYLSYLENDKLCLSMLEKVLNLYPQDNVSSIQMRLLQMWSFSRIRNVELTKNIKSRYNDILGGNIVNNKNNNILCISEKSIPHEVSVSTLIFEIIELHWSVIHPIIIDVYATTSLIHYIRGNWKSCEEILEKAITKCLVLSNRFENENDIIRHFNKLISNSWNKNWEYENKEMDSKNSLKKRVMNSSIKYLLNYSGGDIGNKSVDYVMEDYIYDKIYNSQTQYIPKLLDLIDNPYPNKIPRSPPKLRIAWLLKQLGNVRLIHALENYNMNKLSSEKTTLFLLDDPVETLLELSCMSTQYSLDIFDYYLGSSSLETASCCFELAYGLILLDEIIKNEKSQILLKRSKELLLASFDVNSALLMSSHNVCINNLIQLALVYEKSNLFHQSLVTWEVVLEQLSIKCRSFDDDDYRLNCEFSLTGWFVPNKYFYSPVDLWKNEKISNVNNYENVDGNENYKKNKIIDEYIKINDYEIKEKNYSGIEEKKSGIILSSSYLSIDSSQWNIRNSLILLSKTKERIFYLFINKCNGNKYHKRLFRLFLLASYLKRGDKLVNLKDWEPILSLNNEIDTKTGNDLEKEKTLSGLLFSVIYETNSWLYETEETNLAVSSFIEDHPTKINKDRLFTGDGYSGPLSVLNIKSKMNESQNRYMFNDNIIHQKSNNENGSIDNNNSYYYLSMSGVGKIGVSNSDLYNKKWIYDSKGSNYVNNINKNNQIYEKSEYNKNNEGDITSCKSKKNTKKENLKNMGINLIMKNTRSNSSEIITKIRDSCENNINYNLTFIDSFFIDLISEAENDIKIIWRIIKEQTQMYKKLKINQRLLINKLNSNAQYEKRINRLSKLKINEILNDDSLKKIDMNDVDVEKSVLTRDINESPDISNISEINTSISNPIYRGTLIATICESKNLLSKIMVNNSKKSTFEDEFEQIGSDSLVIYNSILKKETVIDDSINNDTSAGGPTAVKNKLGASKSERTSSAKADQEISEKTKKIAGMKLNLENAFFREDIEVDNSEDYTKSSPLSYRSNALDVLVSIIYNVSDFKDYFNNWKENGSHINYSGN